VTPANESSTIGGVEALEALRRRLRARAVDWTLGANRPPARRPDVVDVIIPVYGAAADLTRCLASIAAETDARHGVILVLDGPQDEATELAATGFAETHRDRVRLLRNDERRGFAGSVNRGIAASTRDVVLLNSDTIVTARWLEKLVDAAYSNGDVGTVTPLSNDATLCSVPRAFEVNLLPSGFDVASFARLVESVSTRSYPRLPTGVGFCLYVRRALLDDIAHFDAVRFPRGYSEENDFCMRALARGWLHVADDATFVFHAGRRSFGATRERELRRGEAAMRKLHPRYEATIADLMARDPLRDVRARIAAATAGPRPLSDRRLRIAHLVHGWPPFQHAGTELYAYWLVARQRGTHDVSVYTRGDDPAREDGEIVELLDGGARVRIVTNHFTARDPLRRNAIRARALERDFERFLRAERPDILHVHHLAGHSFSLPAVARRLGIPIVQQVQDWWFVCARVNLLDGQGNRCAGPAPSRCASCATLTRVPPAPMTNRMVHALRRRAARAALGAADAFVAGSHAIRNDYASVVARATPFHVIPYGIALTPSRTQRDAAQRPVRCGYVGSVAPHKGVHVAVEAMRGIAPSDGVLHVWGDAGALPEYVGTMRDVPNVVFEGRFAEDEKECVYASMDVLLVPSIGLESFGLAAREAMASGVPVVASAGGALSEVFGAGSCGELFPAGDAGALRGIIRRIVADPALIDRWRERLPPTKSDEVHAEEIERVYRSVLAARGR
jgi:glycosyltransferase involved in cell wall biosynthesis/GT2 family glycosyltransferase